MGAGPKPGWLKIRFNETEETRRIAGLHAKDGLFSVCQSALCPNRMECWASGTATFMVMGEYCTRSCRFCAVKTMAKPPPLDEDEPKKLADAIETLGLKYAVITSVTRDDLADGGADHIVRCVREIKKTNPKIFVEALVPDFGGNEEAIRTMIGSGVDVLSHNIETVERLSPEIRDRRASYKQSLGVLKKINEISGARVITKSGLMVGFGESEDEVEKALEDLSDAGIEIVTIGQYLQPSKNARNIPVKEYVSPETFSRYEKIGYELGFRFVASGPFVRSSYRAAEPFIKGLIHARR